MRRVGDWVAEEIKNRTLSGIGSSGIPFRPYSREYARKKAGGDSGGGAEPASPGHVNLKSTPAVQSSRHSGQHMTNALWVDEGDLPEFNMGAHRFVDTSAKFVSFLKALDGHVQTVTIAPNMPEFLHWRATHHNNPETGNRPWFGLSDDQRAASMDVFKRNIIQPNSTEHTTTLEIRI